MLSIRVHNSCCFCGLTQVAGGGSLAHHLGDRAARRLPENLHTTEDEAHYYFKVRIAAACSLTAYAATVAV